MYAHSNKGKFVHAFLPRFSQEKERLPGLYVVTGLGGWEQGTIGEGEALENTPNDLERKRYAYAL